VLIITSTLVHSRRIISKKIVTQYTEKYVLSSLGTR